MNKENLKFRFIKTLSENEKREIMVLWNAEYPAE